MKDAMSSLAVVLLSLGTAVPAVAAPAPPGFDIWVASLQGEPQLRNVTSRPGYDNQPTFESEQVLLFTRLGEGEQTDLARLDLGTGEITPLLETPQSEYSPTPNARGTVSTVRVSLDGVQQLWELEKGADRYSPLLPAIEGVGYHLWLDPRQVALFIVKQPSELHIANLETGKVMIVAKDIGRSMQRPPGTRNALAFIEPGQDEQRWIKKLDLDTQRLTPIVPVLEGSQDFAYLPDGRLLMAHGKQVFAWQAGEWQVFASYPDLPGEISRIAISPSGSRVALVVAEGE